MPRTMAEFDCKAKGFELGGQAFDPPPSFRHVVAGLRQLTEQLFKPAALVQYRDRAAEQIQIIRALVVAQRLRQLDDELEAVRRLLGHAGQRVGSGRLIKGEVKLDDGKVPA